MSVLMEDGTLLPLTARAMGPPRDTKHVARKTRKEICDLWRYIEESIGTSSEGDLDGTWLGFIERAKTKYLTVSAMPFQDVECGNGKASELLHSHRHSGWQTDSVLPVQHQQSGRKNALQTRSVLKVR